MTDYLLLILPSRRRTRWALFVLIFCLSSGTVWGVKPNTSHVATYVWSDSSATRAQKDITTLKKHVQLSKSQEEYIHNMFLSKYQYLEQHQASGPRWELQVEVNKRKLRELLGKEAYLRLDKAGLIGQWFGITQEK